MKSEKVKITLSVEIDENVYECMRDFLNSNSQWNSETIFNASLSLFLMQNYQNIEADHYKACGQRYLHSICRLPPQHH